MERLDYLKPPNDLVIGMPLGNLSNESAPLLGALSPRDNTDLLLFLTPLQQLSGKAVGGRAENPHALALVRNGGPDDSPVSARAGRYSCSGFGRDLSSRMA
jgi:hypothetical protein